MVISEQVKGQLIALGFHNLGNIHRNLRVAQLVEAAIVHGEGKLTSNGAISVTTGKYTGRSPRDRFFVDTPSVHDQIAWGATNVPMSEGKYKNLYYRLAAYLEGLDLYVFDGYIGADPQHRVKVRVVNQYAWQNLFARQMFLRADADNLENFEPDLTIICAPKFNAVPQIDGTASEAFVVINIEEKRIIIGGTSYGGEIKKSAFTFMNYLMPSQNVLPMHCSANLGREGDAALFFGLSGTGKTTLSADTNRSLIGDDEHGWSENGVFNFEGGCYAKCINLTQEGEPQIWEAIRFGDVVENVVIDDKTRLPDYFDASITENTRVAYPIDYIFNHDEDGMGGHPRNIVFLTADAFGVLPPVSKLTYEQACYHFISGYTSKLAGTERGITEPTATFSACFGAPFLPRPVAIYSNMLMDKIKKYNPDIYLLNTGWSGGIYGVGKRIKLGYTRAMVTAMLNGSLAKVEYEQHPVFGLYMPKACSGVPAEILNPRGTWQDKEQYDATAQKLASLFIENMNKFQGIDQAVVAAGPKDTK